MSQASVYLGHSKGSLSGIGCYLLLIKENGVWKIQDGTLARIA